MQAGDRLRTAGGGAVRVVGLRYHAGYARVHTLTVATDHDFFVGSARVLVHNANCPSLRDTYLGRTPGKASRTGREVIERMQSEGKLRVTDSGTEVLFEGRWYPIG